MSYDLVIRNGTVVDGSGLARYRADVGVKDGRIARIGRIAAPADEVIDAEGHVVSPGFVDGHTHMDAQLFWDELGSCSCYHGVTTAVMGNCGFTLAPCREAEADLVFRNLERAEDIDRNAMLTGIDWSWETFPEFMSAVDAVPKGINYAGYIGHAALRTYVMGERAFEEEAGEDDLKTISHPTLVFWSDKNPGSGPDVGERIAGVIPGAAYYCMLDAAHWPQWEHPEEHDSVIANFLKG